MSVNIKIPLQKVSNVTKYSTLTFPTLEDVTDVNSALLKGTFYLLFCKVNSWLVDEIYTLGKIGDITEDVTFTDLSLLVPSLTTSTDSASYALLFKFDDDIYNNSNYNDYITFNVVSSSTTISKSLCFAPFTDFLDGYFYSCNGANTAISAVNYTYNIDTIQGLSVGNSGENTDPEEPTEPEEPEEPTEPIYKDITLTLDKTSFSSAIHSNIELYYSIDNIELVKLGTSKDNNSFTINFDTSKQVHLYYKYVNENIDLSKCVECFYLQNTDVYSVYKSDLMLFSLGSITENDTLKENKIACCMIDTIELVNATCDTTEIDYTNDTTIIVKAKQGYYFNVEPYLYYNRISYSTRTDVLTLNEDRTQASITITANETLNNFYHSKLVAMAELKTVISENYGLITIYKPSKEILTQLPSKTFYIESYKLDDSITAQTYDLSKNILGVLSMPLNIDIVGNKEITLQGKPTELYADYIDNNIHKIDFGSVEIKGIYNNSIDYKNTKLFIYLPFNGLQNLDVNKYMNKIVHLIYTIDLFSGDFLAELQINNIIVDSFSGNLAIKIPYITSTEKSQNISNYSVLDKNNLLSDRIPKIIIETNDINLDTIHTTLQHTKLDTLTGFNSIENLKLNNENYLLQDDIINIKDVLKNGVIF